MLEPRNIAEEKWRCVLQRLFEKSDKQNSYQNDNFKELCTFIKRCSANHQTISIRILTSLKNRAIVKRIILTTLFATLLGSCIFGILFLFESIEMGLYAAVMTFGNILIPTFIGVLLFQVVRIKVKFPNGMKTFILRILILFLVFAMGIILWSIIDVIQLYRRFSELTVENVLKDLHSQFAGFAVIVLSLALAIPSIDLLIDRNASQT